MNWPNAMRQGSAPVLFPVLFPFLFVVLLSVLAPSQAAGDAGVLIPSNNPQPDPRILSLEEMDVEVRIDNGVARVSIRQIFASHSSSVLEGNWVFALPDRATVSDFVVWDGVTRIPGVILERRRASEVYESLKWQAIDPGLLQMGEYGAEEARRTAVFSAKVVPIPAYGFKRVELEYHQRIPVENLRSYFALPLRPDAYQAQTAARLKVEVDLQSKHAIEDFEAVGGAYSLAVTERTPHRIQARFEGTNVVFKEDFAFEYRLSAAQGDALEVLTYRNPEVSTPSPDTVSPQRAAAEPGFFAASALLTPPVTEGGVVGPPTPGGKPPEDLAPPRTVVVLFDNSLSMQWEKLDRSYLALETLLQRLRPNDRFNLALFNTEVSLFAETPQAAGPENVQRALDFVRAAPIRGGTGLEAALETALMQPWGDGAGAAGGEGYVVLLTDGGATRGTIHNGRLAEWFAERWQAIARERRPRTFVFAVGDDANLPLLRMLARQDGDLEWVRSTEPIDFKLETFLSKIGRRPVGDLKLSLAPTDAFDLVYPLEETTYSGSVASWVGTYTEPRTEATFGVSGVRAGEAFELQAKLALPESDLDHPHLPRTWARARVDALLEKIEREGEDRATIDEIIRLAKKYKFVTPYTSFLAAPRSLLRPRVIRPGDPVLRVRTDESIVSVTALFPFGLIKRLKYLGEEDIWQTRFLAPKDTPDGQHHVRLVLRDREGRVYRESKSFLIASKPPVVRVRLDKKHYRRGETVDLRVSASQSTRTLTARMYGVPPVNLRWSSEAGYNTGRLVIPGHLPAGVYSLKFTAEDFAHNIGTEEVSIEVVP